MNNQKAWEELIDVLQRYYDRANPDNDVYNIALIRKDLERYGTNLIVLGPMVLIDGLRQAVELQTSSFSDDEEADKQIQVLGLQLIMCYRSLIKAYGEEKIPGIISSFGSTDEDAARVMAYTIATLINYESPSVASKIPVLKGAFDSAHGTGYKVALAYALLQCGVRETFQSFAIPHLLPKDKHIMLERILGSKDRTEQRFLEWLVLGSIIMDIASEGRAIPYWKGWRRKQNS